MRVKDHKRLFIFSVKTTSPNQYHYKYLENSRKNLSVDCELGTMFIQVNTIGKRENLFKFVC